MPRINNMKWKSFKQEKPLDGQRILIYDKKYNDWHVCIYEGERDLNRTLYQTHIELCIWISVPCLPEDMK